MPEPSLVHTGEEPLGKKFLGHDLQTHSSIPLWKAHRFPIDIYPIDIYPIDRGAWWITVHRVAKELDTAEQTHKTWRASRRDRFFSNEGESVHQEDVMVPKTCIPKRDPNNVKTHI